MIIMVSTIFDVSIVAFDKQEGPLSPEQQEEKAMSKRKMLGNIKFIGMYSSK